MSSFFPSRNIVNAIKMDFPAGCTVELIKMDDPYRKMPTGLKGVVSCVDDTGTVHVNWENGSTLGAVYGEDQIRRVYKNTKIYYLYRDASNYKTQNQIIVSGTITDQQKAEILSCCEGGDFIPEQIGWDLLRGWDVTEDDHPFAELDDDSFEPTDENVTSSMSVDDVVNVFRTCKGNWDAAKYSPVLD